jgi:GntR family transcriptional regulator
MFITINPDAPTPVYRQIISQLRRAIAVGEIKPGDPLPTVRQLAGDLSVNFNTVANAYRALAQEGLVETHQGRGARVIASAKPQYDEHQARGSLEGFLAEMMLAGKSDEEIIELVADTLHEMREC